MKVVLINTPWAKARLPNISQWFGVDFVFDVEEVTVPFVPYQKIPNETGLAALDMGFVAKYKRGFTLFVAPYDTQPRSAIGAPIPGVSSVFGLFLPPAFSPSRGVYRWEWFVTRLFWDSPAIQVFANETDETFVNQVSLGKTFEVYAWHEFCHWLYWATQKPDRTHEYFYSGQPERAREEILEVIMPKQEVTKTKREELLEIANAALGTDVSPQNLAPQELSCAEGVSNLIRELYPDFPILVSTADLKAQLDRDERFKQTLNIKPGNIIISPRTDTVNGHVGIFLTENQIASNTSKNGLFEQNYTANGWVDAFRSKRGLKIYFYEAVDKPT